MLSVLRAQGTEPALPHGWLCLVKEELKQEGQRWTRCRLGGSRQGWRTEVQGHEIGAVRCVWTQLDRAGQGQPSKHRSAAVSLVGGGW